MPLLTGIEWQKATQSEKVAFVWGVCHAGGLDRVRVSSSPPALEAGLTISVRPAFSFGRAYTQVTRKLEYVLNANDTHM